MDKQFVIFTAVVGNYDEIKQPKVVDERFDYVLFSNEIKLNNIGVWEVRPFSYNNPIRTKEARWVKTHPEELLPEYEQSVWIDANIQIISDDFYSRIIDLSRDGAHLATVVHPVLSCIYQEMLVIIYGRYEKESVVLNWGHYLRNEKYPRANGLAETGILYRNHISTKVASFDKLWWWCIDNYSRRDQLSFNYALWKNEMEYEPFFERGVNVRNSTMVYYNEVHLNESKKWIRWGKWEAWLGRYVAHDLSRISHTEKLYYWIYGTSLPHFWAFVLGQVYRIKDILGRLK